MYFDTMIIAALAALAGALFLTPAARRLSFAVGALDMPGGRKIHQVPTPRLGGAAVLTSILAVLAAVHFFAPVESQHLDSRVMLGIALGLLPVILVSVIDDLRSIGALPRLTAHVFGAVLAVAAGVRLNPEVHLFGTEISLGWMAVPLSILWIVGVTNAFNLVDGLDGLSAGLALISALSLGAVSIAVARYEMAIAAFVIAGALAGFLPYNFHPASIFLGDTGAAGIGLLLGCIALRGGSTLNAGLAVLVPVLVLGVPITETLISMSRRLVRGFEVGEDSGVFRSDRGHFHHRLLELGLDHRTAVLTLYAVGLVLAVAAFGSVLLTYSYAAALLGALVAAAFIALRRLAYEEFAFIRRGTLLRMYETPVMRSGAMVVFLDLLLVMASAYAAIALKWDDWGLAVHFDLFRYLIIGLSPIALFSFWSLGVYKGHWKVASVEDFTRSWVASVAATAAGALALAIAGVALVPFSFWVMYGLVLTVLVSVARGSYRMIADWHDRSSTQGLRTVIYGAGKGGVMALRQMQLNREAGLLPLGFVDDNRDLGGKRILGYPVFGAMSSMESILVRENVESIVVSTEKITRERMTALREICGRRSVQLRFFAIGFQAGQFEDADPFPSPRESEIQRSATVPSV